jgi:pyruvate/2-oxoglutarate dehydrogenase complex dihydrolipoamide acyltransferase (E2) component
MYFVGCLRQQRKYGAFGRGDELNFREEAVSDGVENLTQSVQEQVLKSAQDFYGNSLGDLMGQMHNDRSQLQELLEQLPESQEEAREQLEAMVSSCEAIENSLEEVAQQQGVEDAVSQAAQQTQETAGEPTEQVQDSGGSESESGAVEEEEPYATDAARQKAEQLGVDLTEIEGSVAGGRITVKDVVQAAQG